MELNSDRSVLIATSGYSYEDWKGYFYPLSLTRGEMLTYYAQFFRGTEINSSYYRIPALKTFQRLVEKTAAGFEFMVKVHQETTHIRKNNAEALSQLISNLAPMLEANRLKGLLAQFPYSFKNNQTNRNYLLRTRELTGSIPLFVEFRHDSWLNQALPAFLSSHEIGYVNVDQPRLDHLLPPQHWVTNHIGYIRFHGRNEAKWWEGNGSERYDYIYSEAELREWIKQIKSILRQTAKTYIFFNNHPRGQAIKDATQMKELLTKEFPSAHIW